MLMLAMLMLAPTIMIVTGGVMIAPKLCSFQSALAFLGSRDQVLGETPDDGIVQSVFVRLLPYGGHNVRKLLGHGNQCGDHFVRIETRFSRKILPIAQTNLTELVFTAHFHRELDLLQIDVVVGKNAGDVVERREPYVRAAGQQERVILGMCIRTRN